MRGSRRFHSQVSWYVIPPPVSPYYPRMSASAQLVEDANDWLSLTGRALQSGSSGSALINGSTPSSGSESSAASAAVALNWMIPMSPQTMTATIGDTVTFSWVGYHDVYESASVADYDACDTTGGVLLAPGSSGGYHSEMFSHFGTFYFICTIGTHCMSGQKIAITVQAASASSPPPELPLPLPPSTLPMPPSLPLLPSTHAASGDSDGLESGVVTAIVAGGIVAIALLGFCAFVFLKVKKDREMPMTQVGTTMSPLRSAMKQASTLSPGSPQATISPPSPQGSAKEVVVSEVV